MNNIVIDRFLILFSRLKLRNIVDRLFLNEKKQSDKMIPYNYGIVNRAIRAHPLIVKSKRSVLEIFTLVYILHI